MVSFLGGLKIESQPEIREKVYHSLRKRILTGEIQPGTRLIESKLAQEIGTSRTPVREALHNLEFEKIVTALPRVGYVVREITAADVQEICEIRAALESVAVRWALKKDIRELVARLRVNLEQMEICVKKNKLKETPGLDMEFHDLICQASGSRWLTDLNQYLREYMLRLRIQSFTNQGLAERTVKGHRRILAGLKNKDRQSAEESIGAHMQITQEDIITYTLKRSDGENHMGRSARDLP